MTAEKKTAAIKKAAPFMLAACAACAAAVYLFRPPWFDETIALSWLEHPFAYPIPNNHIIYTLLLKLWMQLFGYSVCAIRSLSLVLAIIAVFVLWKRFVRRGTELAAGALIPFLLSGTFCLFATAMRGYMPSILFSFCAFVYSEKIIRSEKLRAADFALYFIFCYLSCGTIPTNILAIGGGLLFSANFGLRSKHDFLKLISLWLIAVFALFLFYLPILPQFAKTAQLAEGWSSLGASFANIYLAFFISSAPLTVAGIAGMAGKWLHFPKLRLRLCCFILLFAAPPILSILFKMPPFPRVFVPFFPLWCLALTSCASRKYSKILLVSSCIWAAAMRWTVPYFSDRYFNGGRSDDLIYPYPLSTRFMPENAAKILHEAFENGKMQNVFIDFSADPPSIAMQAAAFGLPQEIILHEVNCKAPHSLPPNTWIICSNDETLQKLLGRFKITMRYRCINEESNSLQRIYAPE